MKLQSHRLQYLAPHSRQTVDKKVFITEEQLSKVARDAAIAAAEESCNPDWLEAAHRGIKVLAHRRQFLTSDDLWIWLQDLKIPVKEPRAMGSVMAAARRDALITPTREWMESSRSVCHGRPQRVWKSLIYQTIED